MEYEHIGIFYEGYASISKDKKYGFINLNFDIIVPTVFDRVWGFSDVLASVCRDKYWGAIDKQAHLRIPFVYNSFIEFYESIAAVSDSRGIYYIDREGKENRDW